MQKAEIKRQMKKKEEVKKKIKENRGVQERVLARRAMMAAENDLILEETKEHNESRLVLASENIQAMYERRQRVMHQKAEDQERKIVESHTRKLQKEQAERDYYEALLDQKQVRVRNASTSVKKEHFKRAKERFELGNAKTQRHQENYERVSNRARQEQMVLNEQVRAKIEKTHMFGAYKEAVVHDSKSYAAKSRAEREAIRLEARTFDKMAASADLASWVGHGTGTGKVNVGNLRIY